MAALVRTLQADGVFNDIRKLYGIASIASQTMVLSTSLSQLRVGVAIRQSRTCWSFAHVRYRRTNARCGPFGQ
jgi:hypothetical protein